MFLAFAAFFTFWILRSLSKAPLLAKNHALLEEGLHHLAPNLEGIWASIPEDDEVTEECRYSGISFYRLAYLRRLLRTDPSAVFPLLHEWEERGVKSMKLEEHWISTPFPGEKERQDRPA